MIKQSRLNLDQSLPLTCSRSGTCCHGKLVRLNPWELKILANTRCLSTKAFCDQYCEHGGIQLRFDGNSEWRGMASCSQYKVGFGCVAHSGRPLACRLYPLGRLRQGETAQYMYQGKEFPCLLGCPEVEGMPYLSVQAYINDQGVQKYEAAQDAYLEVMQNLAEIAFVLLIDSGLAATGNEETVNSWRKMGRENPDKLVARIGKEWIESLLFPEIGDGDLDPISFISRHDEYLKKKAQESFGSITSMREFSRASEIMMGMALHLGRSLGADPQSLSIRWANNVEEIMNRSKS